MSTPEPSELTRSQRREKAAADALRSLIRETLLEKFPLLGEENTDIPLTLSMDIRCSRQGLLTFNPDLRTQVLDQAEAFLKPREVFHEGSVYDFHGQRPQRPPNALAVFSGYDAFGHPQWSSVPELLPDGGSRKIFRGKELKTEQLPEYGKNDKSFNILAQLILGPLPVPKSYQKLTGSETFALTVQIVETRDTRNHFALALNLLVGGLLPEELDEMIQELPLRHLNQAVLALEESMDRLEHRALQAWTHQDPHAFNHELKKIPGLLGDFSARLTP